MAVTSILLVIGACFVTKNKVLHFLMHTFSLITLACAVLIAINMKNMFNGYSVLIALAIMPQFLVLFDLKEYIQSKKQAELPEEEEYLFYQPEEKVEEVAEEKKEKKKYFIESKGNILKATASLLSAICIGFSGLYIGVETAYGFLIGLAFGLAITFLMLALKKNKNPFDILATFMMYCAIGIMLGQIITVLIYELSIINLLYCAGALIFGGYVLLTAIFNSKYDQIAFYIAIFCLVATFII